MFRRRRLELANRFRRWGRQVETIEFTDRMERLMTRADALVGMAGYNTVVEALSARTPTLVVPREAPRREQVVRAGRLASVPGIDVCAVNSLEPERIGGFIRGALSSPTVDAARLDLGGLEAVAAEISVILGVPPTAHIDPTAGEVPRASRTARVGYVLKKYPRLSETFVLAVMLGLENLGLDRTVYSLRLPDDGKFHADLARLHAPVRTCRRSVGRR